MNTQEVVKRVTESIDASRDGLEVFLGEYVRYRSVNPDMLEDGGPTQLRECQEWLSEQLRSWAAFGAVELAGPDPEQPNVLARRNGQGSGRSLLFNGHSDVVPVTTEQAAAWSSGDPWSGAVADGKLWGRGASDMKGGNAAFLWAVKTLAELGVRLRGDVLATLVSGEETGNHRVGVDVLQSAGYVADLAIVAEPTRLVICPASVGEFYFLVRVQGQSAHLSSRNASIHPQRYGLPVPGVNAIDKMWKVQAALAELEREWGFWQRHPLMPPGQMTINFSRVHGGETYSALAESCELTGSVLFNPSLTFEEVKGEFLRAVDGVAATDYWLRDHPPTVQIPLVLDEKHPVDLPSTGPECLALAQAYEVATGEPAVIGCTPGTNDGAYMCAKGQPLVTCGPGSQDDGTHGPNEYVGMDSVVSAAKFYAAACIEWCGLV